MNIRQEPEGYGKTLLRVQEIICENPGITQAEIARRLGISKQAVNQAIKRLRKYGTIQFSGIARQPKDREQLAFTVDRQLDIVAQLAQVNQQAWELVEQLWPKEGHVLMPWKASALVRALAEIRSQLELQAKLLQMLCDLKAVQEFQEEVLAVITEVNQDVAREIRRRLAERRALRTAVRFN
jgi:DNA-binding MarR family transcriptional regulator